MSKKHRYKIFTHIIREKDTYIVYAPALDLSAYGVSVEAAKKNFHDTLTIFLQETIKKGTLEEILLELGWEKIEDGKAPYWNPPQFITDGIEDVLLPT